MKIAIASDANIVSAHFGHCEGFKIYEIEDKKISNSFMLENPGHKPGFLPVFLKEKGIDLIISGGMGGSAVKLFENNNIEVIVGASGNSDDVIKQYIEGRLISTGSICDH